MLKLLYITNRIDIALVAEKAGVDRIWIDLEVLGKNERQKNLNTVKSKHSVEDIRMIAPCLTKSDLLVRINPWNENSKNEIDQVIEAGADIIMLPYWKTAEEVEKFISHVNGRCRTLLLLETREAVECVDKVILIKEINEFHIGLNDLRISYGYKDMFQPFGNGLLDYLSTVFRKAAIPFGIGGIGQFGLGLSPSPEELIIEHYRLGSSAVILSRTFCNAEILPDLQAVENVLTENINYLRKTEKEAGEMTYDQYDINHKKVVEELR